MTKSILPVSFFFGVTDKTKYCSLFDELYSPFDKGCHLILKGGPGTGKSTIMKKVAEKLENGGHSVERGFCSADPHSLDIVLCDDLNFSVLDGTSPHIFEPTLPGVSEHIVNLGIAWDRKFLDEHINEIAELTQKNKEQHKKAAEYMKVASQIETQSALVCAEFTDKEKVERYAKRLASRIIPAKKGAKQGKIRKRFLSAITPDGVFVHHDSVVALAEKVVTIEDEYGAVAPYIAEYICNFAAENGYDVYACFCPLFPRFKMEHIIIPELKTAIFTENSYHYSADETGSRVHVSRFYDKSALSHNREKLTFYKKAKKELLDEAVRKLSLAKDFHDRLEDYYIKSTDFDVINGITEKILLSLT